MLKNVYLLAKIGADTAENERNFAKNWQRPYGSSAVGSLAVDACGRKRSSALTSSEKGVGGLQRVVRGN